jgi:putative transposase
VQQALVSERGLSARASCRLTRISRSHLNDPGFTGNDALQAEIRRLSYKFPRFGYRRIHGILTKQMGCRRGKGVKSPEQATRPNHVWTVDFVQDSLSRGSKIRLLTVLDEFTRESLCIRVERRLKAEDVRMTLEALFKDYGIPMYLRSDNGSEFIAQCLQGWLKEQGTKPLFIEPGSPWQNGKCESFNGRFRDECLDMEVFDSLPEAQYVIERWREHYNSERPHSALAYLTPFQFIQEWQSQQNKLKRAA